MPPISASPSTPRGNTAWSPVAPSSTPPAAKNSCSVGRPLDTSHVPRPSSNSSTPWPVTFDPNELHARPATRVQKSPRPRVDRPLQQRRNQPDPEDPRSQLV